MSLILNGDTGISAVDGTASAPALVGNDTDTGVYFSAANTLDFATAGTRRASINSTGDLQFNSGYGSVATAYGCRAWVNFDGTGTVAIRASGNVTSITDNGTGTYTINFTNAMPDVNYATVVSGGTGAGNANNNNSPGNATPTASAFPIQTFDYAFTLADWAYNQVAVFR